MNLSSVIKLVDTPQTKDADGVWRTGAETARTVFANVKSASSKEFHEGFRNGLNPQFVFTMFLYDYKDESAVEYEGSRYSVYRTFCRGADMIELHAERKGGTNVVDCNG